MHWQVYSHIIHCLSVPSSCIKSIPWLQKIMSITNDIFVHQRRQTPYIFTLFKNSVYSFHLEDNVASALSLGLLRLHPAPGGYGQLVIDENVREKLSEKLQADSQWLAAIDYVSQQIQEDTIIDLDKLALASWFLARDFPYDRALGELIIRKGKGLQTQVGTYQQYVDRTYRWLAGSLTACYLG